MRGFTRRLGVLGDVTASGVLVAITSLVNFLSILVFARSLGPAAFGLYSTCRRVVAFVAPFVNLGGHLGVSRYLGYYAGESRQRSSVLALGLALCLVALPLTVAVFLPLESFGKNLGWVRDLQSSVWMATICLTAATAAGLVVFSILRGYGHPQGANLHQLVVLTVFLGVGVLNWGAPVQRVLFLFAAASWLANLGFLLWVVHAHRRELHIPSMGQIRAIVREMSRYSLPRLADGPLQASLSLICVLLAPGIGGLALSGYIHISQTMVRVTEVLIVPLSVIFLPLVARQVREGRMQTLSRQAQLIYDSVVLIGLLLVGQSMVWGPVLLAAAFGSRYAEALPYLMLTLPAILPFLLYAGFRSFIDGYSVRPVNCLHLTVASVAVLLFGGLAGGVGGGLGLSAAYTFGMLLLGVLSVRYAAKHFGTRPWSRHQVSALILASGAALATLPLARACQAGPSFLVFMIFGVSQMAAFTLALWLAHRMRHPTLTYAVLRWRAARNPATEAQPFVSQGGLEGLGMNSGDPVGEPARSGSLTPETTPTHSRG